MLSVANVFFLLKHALLKTQKYTRATKYLNISECFVKLNKVHKLLLEQKKTRSELIMFSEKAF